MEWVKLRVMLRVEKCAGRIYIKKKRTTMGGGGSAECEAICLSKIKLARLSPHTERPSSPAFYLSPLVRAPEMDVGVGSEKRRREKEKKNARSASVSGDFKIGLTALLLRRSERMF